LDRRRKIEADDPSPQKVSDFPPDEPNHRGLRCH